MKARQTPNRRPLSPVDSLWDHADRLDTLERRGNRSSPFLREHIFAPVLRDADGVTSGRSEPFVHIDGAQLAWAIALLDTPGVDNGVSTSVTFRVDGLTLGQKITFKPGVTRSTVAFDPRPILVADKSTLSITVTSGDLMGGERIAVHCRFVRVDF